MKDVEMIARKTLENSIEGITCAVLSDMPETMNVLYEKIYGDQEDLTEIQCILVESTLLKCMSDCWSKKLADNLED